MGPGTPLPVASRSVTHHLRKDAAQAPDVDGRRVILAAQEDLGGSVPEGHHLPWWGTRWATTSHPIPLPNPPSPTPPHRHIPPPHNTHLVRVGAHGHPEGASQAEVGQFDGAVGVDEQVLGLEVAVQHAVRVAEGQALQQLEQVALRGQGGSAGPGTPPPCSTAIVLPPPRHLDEGQGDAADGGGIHELLQVLVQELEDQVELVLRVDHVQQPGGARIAWAGARVGGWRPRDPPWPWLSTGVPAATGFWHGHGSPQPWGLAWPRLPTAPGVPLTPAKAPLAQSQAHGMAGLWRPPRTPGPLARGVPGVPSPLT